MAKIILLTGTIVGYAYADGVLHRLVQRRINTSSFAFFNRAFGPLLVGTTGYCTHDVLQRHLAADLLVQAGSGFNIYRRLYRLHVREHRDVVRAFRDHRRFARTAISFPSSGALFYPTWVDIWTFVGTFGIFLSLFLLFIRFLPMIAMSRGQDRHAEADPHHAFTRSATIRSRRSGKERT